MSDVSPDHVRRAHRERRTSAAPPATSAAAGHAGYASSAPTHLGAGGGRAGPGRQQDRLDLVQHRPVTAEQLDLPLPPLQLGPVGEPPRAHPVVGDLGDGRAGGVAEHVDGAVGDQLHHGLEGPVLHEAGDEGGQLVGHAVLQRQPQLLPVAAGGDLEVPAGVVPTGPAPQRRARAAQCQVDRVDVARLEREALRRPDGPAAGEVGHGGVEVDVVLALHLEGTRHVGHPGAVGRSMT